VDHGVLGLPLAFEGQAFPIEAICHGIHLYQAALLMAVPMAPVNPWMKNAPVGSDLVNDDATWNPLAVVLSPIRFCESSCTSGWLPTWSPESRSRHVRRGMLPGRRDDRDRELRRWLGTNRGHSPSANG